MMALASKPIIGFAAFSGTGKTTLLCQIIPLLTARGLRLGLVKHSHHRFEMDRPGKDSYILRHAGAQQVVVASRRRTAVLSQHPAGTHLGLAEFLDRLGCDDLDVILVEGYKYFPIPKIELHRPSLGQPLLALNDPDIIAVATDAPLPDEVSAPVLNIPVLDINDPAMIAEFILARIFP